MKSMNICLISPVPPPYGGISNWTVMICKYAEARSDVRITVVNTAPRLRAIYDVALWKRVIFGSAQFLVTISQLFWLLLTRHFHTLHLTTSGQLAGVRDLGIVCLSILFRVPLVYHIRFGRVPFIAKENSREWRWMARVMRKADTVVAIDKATKDTIKKKLPSVNVELIPNCISLSELPQSKKAEQDFRTVIFIGWVIPTKGIGELLDAWNHLKHPMWLLKIVGPGDPIYIKELIAQFQPRSVEFLGELPHAEALEQLSRSDVFVLPSYTEGFPNVLLEAMALGKAIVATNVGAIPEMLEGGCGIIVDKTDVRGLIAAMQKLVNDRKLCVEYGKRARDRANKNYSIENVFNKYLMIWSNCRL